MEAMGLGSVRLQLPICNSLCAVMLGDLPPVQERDKKRSVRARSDGCQGMVSAVIHRDRSLDSLTATSSC